VCLFSYGQTGSGKTHTMQGTTQGENRGIIPRSIEKVLQESKRLASQGWEYNLQATFVEIYNETIKDLLEETKGPLSIKMDARGQPCIPGATRVPIINRSQIDELMKVAAKARSVACTSMNDQSSRSHSVFTLHLTGENSQENLTLRGQLNLCDLAGSERLSRSGAVGDRLKETQAINKSLSALADVFHNLKTKSSHVPYRNSKLTHMLQSCFSGQGKTMMLVNLSPTMASTGESLCSLRFASKVNKTKLDKPKKQVQTQKTI